MKKTKAIKILQDKLKCLHWQTEQLCDLYCENCPLCLKDKELVEAVEMAIDALAC